MNSGIAKEIRARWPQAFSVYRKEFERSIDSGLEAIPLGTITYVKVDDDKYIVNAITQQDYGREPGYVYVDYSAMALAFESLMKSDLHAEAQRLGVNFPLIGCGLANGNWSVVSNIIDTVLETSGINESTLWRFP
jgi:O-acetyl-ADP-ribose deacetylase (regulator of RNase III)